MFCPSCGANNSTEQKFCRSCGLNLEQTAFSLLEQMPDAGHAELRREERLLDRFGTVAFTGFGLVVLAAVIGMIYAAIRKMILSGTEPLTGILLVSFIIFAGLALAYVFWSESLKHKRAKLKAELAPEIPSFQTPKTEKSLSDTPFQAVPTVVEETTDLLPVESKTRKLQR